MRLLRRLTDHAAVALLTAAIPAALVAQATSGIQHIRPNDKSGINVFEAPKQDTVAFNGLKLSIGAAFTQQFQNLNHENTASPNVVNNVDLNKLTTIGSGFNNANANLYVNAQLAKGIRVALTSYLSSRHHNETWVKDGYLLVDDSPIENPLLEEVMKYVTLRIGHFEVNYGDAHFRRTDNGNSMYNPFVGNLITDAFTTEVGGEVYVRTPGGLMLMGGMTGGEIRGTVTRPDDRSPTYLAKAGFDRQLTDDIRVRLTGSHYTTRRSMSNTLYGGDRAGSRYYWVLENTASTTTESANFTSGLINPGFRSKISATMINPFVKVGGLELFGTYEEATGRAANETTNRDWSQKSGEVIYRFLKDENIYLAARLTEASGELSRAVGGQPVTMPGIEIERSQFGGGWFITRNILMKAEYVTQKYKGFPTDHIFNGGKFNGLMFEGVVSF